MNDTTYNNSAPVPNDLDILEEIKIIVYQAIINNETPPKVGDLLKIIEMKNKLTVSGESERKFWAMINEIREKELTPRKNALQRKTDKPVVIAN